MSVPSGRRSRSKWWLIAVFLLGPVVVGTLSVTTATNTVPDTRLGATSHVIGVTELRPYVCSPLAVTTLVTGRNQLSGTDGSDLILAGSHTVRIDGNDGDDCIVGGSRTRHIDGGSGYNICIGPQAASFANCELIIRQ